MAPTLGPELVASPPALDTPPERPPPLIIQRGSSSSLRSASSTNSIPFGDVDVEIVTLDGLPHVTAKLEARKYKDPSFRAQLLEIILAIPVSSWTEVEYESPITPTSIIVSKVAGSLTNAVFFVSCPSASPPARTLLLRIYGPSSGALIDRASELHTLHVLSSQYRIGPRIHGTFENGRIEEYFDSSALSAAELRDARVSRWIGARMAELHCVDLEAVADNKQRGAERGLEIAARKNLREWLVHAHRVMQLPQLEPAVRAKLDLDTFKARWDEYMAWLEKFEQREGGSKRVFAHNDTQYGNLLRLNHPKPGIPEHRQIIVVDFEYASPNSAAFDVANHFHEWTADYHSPTPHILDSARYPSLAERRNFYAAYLAHSEPPLPTGAGLPDSGSSFASFASDTNGVDDVEATYLPPIGFDLEREMVALERQVQAWSPSTHAMWAVWGIVQARDDLERDDGQIEFDYVGYALCRMQSFYCEVARLGL